MIFEKLYQDLNSLAGQENGDDFETLGKLYINQVYRRLLSVTKTAHDMREVSLTTTANTGQYGLPLQAYSVLNFDPPNGTRRPEIITDRAFDIAHPGNTTTGDPEQVYVLGMYGVQAQPASAGVLGLYSSSTADSGTSYPVYVYGEDANGVKIRERVNLNGTTEANTTQSFTTVDRIVKDPASTNFAGTVTVEDSSDNVLARIPIWWVSPSYLWVEFWPTPGSAITYTTRIEERKHDLVEAEDWPEIDEDYHDLLFHGAAMDLLPKVGMPDVAASSRATFEKRFDEYVQSQNRDAQGRVQTFSEIWAASFGRQRPGRPLIEGVDF